MPKLETQKLVKTHELSRYLTKIYCSILKGKEEHKVFEIETNQLKKPTSW